MKTVGLTALLSWGTTALFTEQRMCTRGCGDLTTMQMINLVSVLDSFNLDNNRYPESLDDLVVMPNYVKPEKYQVGGYLKELPTDGWGNNIIYRRITGAKKYALISLGADGKTGGEGINADIVK